MITTDSNSTLNFRSPLSPIIIIITVILPSGTEQDPACWVLPSKIWIFTFTTVRHAEARMIKDHTWVAYATRHINFNCVFTNRNTIVYVSIGWGHWAQSSDVVWRSTEPEEEVWVGFQIQSAWCWYVGSRTCGLLQYYCGRETEG